MPLTIAVAPDSFKGTLSALEAAEAMAEGVRRVRPDARVLQLPMADGGEGTAALLAAATGGDRVPAVAPDPLGRPVTTELFRLGTPDDWAVEVAAATGLTRLAPDERRPLLASSAGTGALVGEAVARGARSVIVGLGGSATVDGGKGALEALGFRFLDASGTPVAPGGAGLVNVAHVDDRGVPARVRALVLRAAHDTESPLTGPRGAAAVFGPQKGAGPADVVALEAGLARWATVLLSHRSPEVALQAGMGAAGGIGFGLHALLGARLEPGGELVWQVARYESALAGSDLVLTGEGRLDGQTATGKAPAVVARHAQARGLPVLAVAGCLGPGARALCGIVDLETCTPAPPDPLPTASAAASAVAAATERLLRRFLRT